VRCDQTRPKTDADPIRCSLDIASAIESVNGMINVILKAVDTCGKLKTENHDCGLAVGVLTESFAGLAAASSGIVAKCPNQLNGFKPLATVGQAMANAGASAGAMNNNMNGNQPVLGKNMQNLQGGPSFGQCVVNVKNSMKSLFKAIKRIMTVKHNCKKPGSKHCVHNSLKIMGSFVALGEYLSGAIGKCTPITAKDAQQTKAGAICAQYSLKLIKQVGDVDRASVQMARKCALTRDQRLYLEEGEDGDEKHEKKDDNTVTMGLAALLPVSAIVSFAFGKRIAKTRVVRPEEDCEVLVPELE